MAVCRSVWEWDEARGGQRCLSSRDTRYSNSSSSREVKAEDGWGWMGGDDESCAVGEFASLSFALGGQGKGLRAGARMGRSLAAFSGRGR